MKKTLAILSLLLLVFFKTNGQNSTLDWESTIEQKNDTTYTLTLKATLKKGWHLYSQQLPEGGPLPTRIYFENPNSSHELIGKTEESETKTSYEEIFDMQTSYFEKEAIFKQKIKILSKKPDFIKATISYQTCNDKACTFEPGEDIYFYFNNRKKITEPKSIDSKSIHLSKQLHLNLSKKELFLNNTSSLKREKKSVLSIFLLGFFGGLIALLTPCVFPMIPLTVSFFTKQTKNRKKGISNAILYGLFIVLIYLLLSSPFHFLDSLNPEILNTISTNLWLNLFFFVIFIVFAFSFFGFFEINLPHSWSDKIDGASSIGGIIGTFFMALTLAIVSFSCTGPILGSLLVGALSSDGGAMQLSFGMLGFGTALALPFSLFALFPNWLNTLPKSGGWLNTVKIVLGFLEIALAFKFLSNADMVEHWGLLKREVFISIWLLIFVGLTLYLFGLFRFPHDTPYKKLGLGRIATGFASTLFTIYLISGLFFNSSLNVLSGFAPPKFYSIFKTKTDCPLNLNCFKDFEEGLQYAKEAQKPILLDFTGWACINCRKMEENVWSFPEVHKELEKYVLISLYVDDRKELPKELHFDYQKTNGKIKRITTVGSKWATFQTINFSTASQPFYVQISPTMELLNYPEKYTDKATYLQWLKEGLHRFKNKK